MKKIKKNMSKRAAKINEKGFTILETLVAVSISGILMAGIYSTYYSQQKSSVVQGQVAAMQQNLRAAMCLMTTEIRMAGYDPLGSAGTGILTANSDSIRVTMDTSGDGVPDDTNEDVTYSLYDADSDGDNDLGRNTGGGNAPAAANIDALNLVYLDAAGAATATVSQMRSVQIAVVARTEREDPGYTNNETYTNQLGTTIYTAPGDHYRRRLSIAQVKCRNLGL
ncbi:MAG: PilW family protein [Deltaproteobacteria bacterium]|nr:PilW family protein [Deltaproteobacteria bacterium]